MKSNRYVLTTSTGTRSSQQIWDSSRPLGIGHPFRWVLEKTSDGVRLRDLTSAKASPEVMIPLSHLEKGERIELEKGIELTFKPLRPPKAAYLSIVRDNKSGETKNGGTRLLAFAGVRHWTTNCEAVHSTYVGYQRGRPVFVATQTRDGIQVKPLLKNVFFKVKGHPSLPAEQNQPVPLTWDVVRNTTVIRGNHWWKFNIAREAILATPRGNITLVGETKYERNWLIATGTALFVTIAFLLTSSLFVSNVPDPVQIEHVAPLVTFKSFNTGKMSASSPAPLSNSTKHSTAPAAKAARAVPVAPVEAVAPVAPVSPVKAKAPAPIKPAVAAVNPPATVQPRNIKAQTPKVTPKPSQQRMAAANARMIQQALLGAKSLTEDSSLDMERPSAPRAVSAPSESLSDTDLNTTDVKPLFEVSSKKVEAIGDGSASANRDDSNTQGSKNATGYGRGAHAGLNNDESSPLLAIAPKGMQVQEGLTKEEVGAVIHQHLREVRYCHESAMLSNPGAQGKVVLAFTIDPRGGVAAVKQDSTTFPDSQISDCLMQRMKTWTFPKPKGGVSVSVSYPFLFRVLSKE